MTNNHHFLRLIASNTPLNITGVILKDSIKNGSSLNKSTLIPVLVAVDDVECASLPAQVIDLKLNPPGLTQNGLEVGHLTSSGLTHFKVMSWFQPPIHHEVSMVLAIFA